VKLVDRVQDRETVVVVDDHALCGHVRADLDTGDRPPSQTPRLVTEPGVGYRLVDPDGDPRPDVA
jgi:hypothetical protein